jgi:hypothetical protein
MAEKAASLTDDEAQEYAAELAKDRIVAICRESRGVAAQTTCVRDEIFRGFDTTGEAKRHCDADAPIGELRRCAIIGSFGYEIALAADLPLARLQLAIQRAERDCRVLAGRRPTSAWRAR